MMPKLGRLFWKFFLIFWLAQFLTASAVGMLFWLFRNEFEPHSAHHRPAFTHEGRPAPPAFEDGAMPHPPPPPGEPGPRRSVLPPPLPLIAGSIVSLVFAALLAWYFSRPIRSLRRAFEAVAGGALETRVADGMGRRQDELADLGKDFDRMAARLQAVVEGQQRLLHDVSHELRSPLARLQAAADLWRQQPERAEALIERVERETARMDRLVGELLTLARVDSGMAMDASIPVDLEELLHGIAQDIEFEALRRRCRVDLALDSPCWVSGNQMLLHRAFENVVRNALQHSPDGSVIGVSALTRGGLVCIEVLDQGPGVAEADLARIFEPFFRSPSDTAVAGYGLGLAITRQVIRAHGGQVSVANLPGGGLCVSLCLPRHEHAAAEGV
ncbi:MAG TPA: ATP-binding protein [Rhodocyclaceae bacterium]